MPLPVTNRHGVPSLAELGLTRRLTGGTSLLLRDLVRVGLDRAALVPAAALTLELDRIAREERERPRDRVDPRTGRTFRTCRLCGREHELTAEHFYVRSGKAPETRCQTCRCRQRSEARRAWREREAGSRKQARAA